MSQSAARGLAEATVLRLAARILRTPVAGTVRRIPWEDGGGFYDVWRIDTPEPAWILKRSDAAEAAFYREAGEAPGLARCLGETEFRGKIYLLLEHFNGRDLTRCRRADLRCALDALIALQSRYWECEATPGEAFAALRESAARRRETLRDETLRRAFDEFLRLYDRLPRTLVHADLLPFNVLSDGTRAVLIDWESGGCGPYPASLARLIAHGTPSPDGDFTLSAADRAFAISYYYERLLRPRGIGETDYRRALTAFLFFERTEWIFVHEKYGTPSDNARYLSDLREAPRLAAALLDGEDNG